MSTKGKTTAVELDTMQICIDIRKDQKEAMEKIKEQIGSPVAFQIRAAIDGYLKKQKH